MYLTEKYDIERRISVADADEQAHQLQWLFFQASGQGSITALSVSFLYKLTRSTH